MHIWDRAGGLQPSVSIMPPVIQLLVRSLKKEELPWKTGMR